MSVKAIETVVDRAVKAIRFMTAHRFFTVQDLQEELGLKDDQCARKYLDAVSIYYPVIEVKPRRKLGHTGSDAALYAMQRDKQ